MNSFVNQLAARRPQVPLGEAITCGPPACHPYAFSDRLMALMALDVVGQLFVIEWRFNKKSWSLNGHGWPRMAIPLNFIHTLGRCCLANSHRVKLLITTSYPMEYMVISLQIGYMVNLLINSSHLMWCMVKVLVSSSHQICSIRVHSKVLDK